jgi:hypothetical protein
MKNMCRRIFISNIQLKNIYSKILGGSYEFMHIYEAKIISNTNNLFKKRFLMHMGEVLGKKNIE